MLSRGLGPAQPLSGLPGVGQASPNPFPENLPLELGKDGHGTTGRRGQIQRLHQRNETDSQMLQFLEGSEQVCYRSASTIQSPDQHDVDLPAARGLQQILPP